MSVLEELIVSEEYSEYCTDENDMHEAILSTKLELQSESQIACVALYEAYIIWLVTIETNTSEDK